MKADFSQPTLGFLRRILEELQPDEYIQDDVVQFWRNAMFDFGFAPEIIDVATSYAFKWGEIIPDLFVGRFGRQNSYFSNTISPFLCEQTLKRLAAFGLFHSIGLAIGDKFRESLSKDGFELKGHSNSDLSVPAEIQQKLDSPLSSTELEISNLVLDRFLNLHESTSRKPLVIEFKTPDFLDRLVQCSILRVQNQHYLPLSLAFHYSGDAVSLDRAKRSLEITLHVLQNLYQVEPNKPESHFTVEEVETHARKMYEKFEPDSLKLGLYLVQELPGVLEGWGCNTQGTDVTFVRISEGIVTLDISAAWSEHVSRRKNFIEREQLQKILPRDDQLRNEIMTPSPKPAILVLISHSSKDVDLATALIELLRAGLGLVATQIRCSSVDGYKLPAGVDSDAQLRQEITDAGILVGLLTPNSLTSTYVLFELGARWGIMRSMIPLLAGVTPEDMRGPHRVLNALSCSNESQLIQFVEDMGEQLQMSHQSPSSYLDKVRAVKKIADMIPAPGRTAPENHENREKHQKYVVERTQLVHDDLKRLEKSNQPWHKTLIRELLIRGQMDEAHASGFLATKGFPKITGALNALEYHTNFVSHDFAGQYSVKPEMREVLSTAIDE
jgi:hypothetical protein